MTSHVTISTTRTAEGPTRSSTQETRTSSSTYSTESTSSYRASIAPRNVVIQRTAAGLLGSGGRSSYTIERSYGMQSAAAPAGAYAAVTNTGVTAVKNSREREKKDMQDLNERFASYIEKVRFLEAQNRRLADELDKLKQKWGKETTQIKAMYQAELDEARKCLDDSDKDKARLEIRVASLEEQLEESRSRLQDANKAVIEERERNERQIQQLVDYEAEINLMRRRVELLESDRDKDKKLIAQLQDALNRARIDLDNETLLHIDAENRRQTLEEEIEFLKAVHEQELKELAALAYRDTTAENREFWKNEMGQALREIHQVYDGKLDGMRNELETFYNLKIQEFRTGATKQNLESVHAKEESKRLRVQLTEQRDRFGDLEAKNHALQNELDQLRRDKESREQSLESEVNEYKLEISKLRAEMEAILKELQGIMDSKLGLELEIAAYRKLLEGEENRQGLRQVVESMASTQEQRLQSQMMYGVYGSSSSSSYSAGATGAAADTTSRVSQVTKGEMSAKTTYQRSAKGPVSIAECAADGKFVALENTGRKEENLDGFRVRRNIDGIDKPDFPLNYITIQPMAKIKIWAQGTKPANAPPTDLEFFDNWGTGSSIKTTLINQLGEDRATHIQKTVYS